MDHIPVKEDDLPDRSFLNPFTWFCDHDMWYKKCDYNSQFHWIDKCIKCGYSRYSNNHYRDDVCK